MNKQTLLSMITRKEFDEILFRSLRSVHKFERAKVREFGLDYESIFLLQFLRRHSPAKMSEIAGEMNIPVSTATRAVDRLESSGYISRKKDRYDKRIIIVSLRAKGEEIVKAVEQHTFDILTANLQDFREDQFIEFIQTAMNLEKLLKLHQD